jgi:hypothetical protein
MGHSTCKAALGAGACTCAWVQAVESGRGERSGGHTFQLGYEIAPAAGMIEVA